MMTAQETFDKIATHLFAQGERAMGEFKDGGNVCLYRTKSGLKCAVGCIIPDDIYSPRMETNSVNVLSNANQFPTLNDTLPELQEHLELLRTLQGIHDTDSNWDATGEMKGALASCAISFGLNTRLLRTLSFSDR